MTRLLARSRASHPSTRSKAYPLAVERLEDRFLLYATTGARWSQPKRITYSFVPDGTNVGGLASNLQQTLNARFSAATWQQQFAMAAAVWQKVANVNFVLVPDNGSPVGVSGNQQSDPRFGDIRIGGFAQASNQLAFAYLPPPFNGGTKAGDVFFNTSQVWQIDGSTYDLETVAIHELGHAIGMSHSTSSAASMYPSYNNTKQTVTSDDTDGIRTIYNGRQNDFFDANGANNSASTADLVSSYIDSTGQLTLSSLDSTTPLMIASGDLDWYKVTVPTSTTGKMVVRMQSAGLSVLSPSVAVYNAAGTTILGQQSSLNYGDTVSVTISGVTPGQVFEVRCKGATTGDSGFGAYGLQINFGSLAQPPVTAPNTFMAEQTDQGGGSMGETTDGDTGSSSGDDPDSDGTPSYWVYDDGGSLVDEDTGSVISPYPATVDTADSTTNVPDAEDGEIVTVGTVSGLGDAMMIDPAFAASVRGQGTTTPNAPVDGSGPRAAAPSPVILGVFDGQPDTPFAPFAVGAGPRAKAARRAVGQMFEVGMM